MAALRDTIAKLKDLDGYIGSCVVDSNRGVMLAANGGGQVIDLEVAATGNSEVVRAKRETMKSLGIADQIEDILITLGRQYHLIRPLPSREGLFLYLVLDKSEANLATSRMTLAQVEGSLTL